MTTRITKAQEFLLCYEELSRKHKIALGVGAAAAAGAAALAHHHGYLGGAPAPVNHHILKKLGVGLGVLGAGGAVAAHYLAHSPEKISRGAQAIGSHWQSHGVNPVGSRAAEFMKTLHKGLEHAQGGVDADRYLADKAWKNNNLPSNWTKGFPAYHSAYKGLFASQDARDAVIDHIHDRQYPR